MPVIRKKPHVEAAVDMAWITWWVSEDCGPLWYVARLIIGISSAIFGIDFAKVGPATRYSLIVILPRKETKYDFASRVEFVLFSR